MKKWIILFPASLVAGVDWSDARYNPPAKRYVTSNKDLVINLIPSALPANTTQSVASQDNKNHSLILTYLTDIALLEAIKLNYCVMISTIAEYIVHNIPRYFSNNTILLGISDPSYINDAIFLERGIFYTVMQRADPYNSFRGQISVGGSKHYSMIKTDYNFKTDCIEWEDYGHFCKRYKYRQVEEHDLFPNDDDCYWAGISYARCSNCFSDMNKTNDKIENIPQIYDQLIADLINTGYIISGTYILTNKFILQ